jgi:exodeoxyribonuclease VII small subunit
MTIESELQGKSFEELLELLEQTINELDGTSLTLEQSLDAYERSVKISEACEKMLDEAELRIRRIDASRPDVDPLNDMDDEDVPF